MENNTPINPKPTPLAEEPTPLKEAVHTNDNVEAEKPEAATSPTKDNYLETSPVVEDKEIRGSQASWPRFSFMNNNIDVALEELSGMSSDNPKTEAFNFYTPHATYLERANSDDAEWCQHIKHNDRVIGPVKPRLRSTGGHVTGRAAIELIRRNSGNGGSLTYQLPHTGITITMEPAKESRFIDLEFSLQHQATQVGMSTTGLLLNARSGVFSEALIRFALEHITSTNYATGADELVETLLDIIDPLDYGALIWGVMATKFANGHPWEFHCVSKTCDHRRTAMINFARMLWIDKAALTEKQLNLLANNQTSITNDLLKQYQEEFKTPDSNTVTLNDGAVIAFGRSSLRHYITCAKRWVDDIERTYTKSMTNYTTQARRSEFLDGQVQARRMLKFEHIVKEIRIPGEIDGEFIIIDDAETIREALIEYSTLSENFSIFEEGADRYINDSTIAIVGYSSQKCQACNHVPSSSNGGRHRSIVPIAIDRLLFMLVQQRNLIMSEMANV